MLFRSGALAMMISEGRRMGINLILATQMILHGTTNAVQQRISQCALILYFKPAINRIPLTARMIAPSDRNRWAMILGKLQVGEFVATGNLLVANRSICYPIKVCAMGENNYHPCISENENLKTMSVNGAS